MTLSEFLQREDAGRPHLMVLGHPISHSLSPLMHNTAAAHYGMDLRYFAVNLLENEFSTLAAHFNNKHFRGCNITVPYKEMLMSYPDRIDSAAREIGAINTIVRSDGRLVGANTDIHGFCKPLEWAADELEGMRAVVFGTGGAAKAVVAGLLELGMEELVLVSRRPRQVRFFEKYPQVTLCSYSEWTAHSSEASLVVNTTPLGMEAETSPVRDGEIECLEGKICYDIVYKPKVTRFLRQAREAGAETIGGLDMLIHQGSESFRLWTGRPFPITLVKEKLHEHLYQ